MQPVLKLELLGGFQVTLDGKALDGFISNKARALLAYIALADKPRSRQVLAELLWGDRPDTTANSSLRMALSNLRSLVGPYLQISRSEVAIAANANIQLDVTILQAKLAPQTDDMRSLEEGVALYRGDLLEGFFVRDARSFEEWVLWQRERLRQMVLQALYRLSMHYTEHSDYSTAIKYTRRLLGLEPWHEQGHRQMMLLLALSGNRSAALAQYETCRRILAEELNVDPLPETNALLERIKTMPQANVMSNASRSNAGASQETANSLFGRHQELSWLLHEWEQVHPQQGQLTLIEGEMGIGKTRLVEEVLRRIAGPRVCILAARCHEFNHTLPYQPIIDLLRMGLKRHPGVVEQLSPVWLRQLATLLPELHETALPDAGSVSLHADDGLARQHLFEAVHQFLKALTLAARPTTVDTTLPVRATQAPAAPATRPAAEAAERLKLVIFIDDLHWIDDPSVDMLRYLAYRLNEYPLWLLGAYQSEGVPADHPFLRLRRALIGEAYTAVLTLSRLPADAILDWVTALPGLEDSQVHELAEVIVQRAEGNPFVTSQVLRELRESTSIQRMGNGWRLGPDWSAQVHQIPFAVREIVLLKLSRLKPGCLELLSTAAAIGETFDLATLYQMSNGVEDIKMCVFDWLEQGLVTWVEPGVYKFSHAMYREIAIEWLSPWHRLRASNRPARNAQSSTGNVVRLPTMRVAGA